jgi:hypothetical protein
MTYPQDPYGQQDPQGQPQPPTWHDPTAPQPPPPAFPPPAAFPAPGEFPAAGQTSGQTPGQFDQPGQYGQPPAEYPAGPVSSPTTPYPTYAASPAPYQAPGYQTPGYPPPGYPSPYGPVAVAPTNGLAVAALVTAIIGLGPVAAILGHVARRQIRERGEQGDGLALAGIIVGWATTALWVLCCGGYALAMAGVFGSFATMNTY